MKIFVDWAFVNIFVLVDLSLKGSHMIEIVYLYLSNTKILLQKWQHKIISFTSTIVITIDYARGLLLLIFIIII